MKKKALFAMLAVATLTTGSCVSNPVFFEHYISVPERPILVGLTEGQLASTDDDVLMRYSNDVNTLKAHVIKLEQRIKSHNQRTEQRESPQ